MTLETLIASFTYPEFKPLDDGSRTVPRAENDVGSTADVSSSYQVAYSRRRRKALSVVVFWPGPLATVV